MSILKEFKEFSLKGNMVDLAIGVIIGGAFGKVVTILVEKILMPPLGMMLSGMDFSQMALTLKTAGPDGKGAVVIGYGEFIQVLVHFAIVAVALFLMIKMMNTLKRETALEQQQTPPPPTPEEIILLREIRDSLKK